jgi:hypothetical protein
MRAICTLVENDGQLGNLACIVLLKASQDKLLDLFLCHLPALYATRNHFLKFVLRTFDKFSNCMSEVVDQETGICLLTSYMAIGIPNFLIAQCLSSLEDIDSPSPESYQIAVALVVKTWLAFPSCLSGKVLVAVNHQLDSNLENQIKRLVGQPNQSGRILHTLKQIALAN